MSWNYRIVREKKNKYNSYSMREVHYDSKWNPVMMTEPLTLTGEKPEDIIEDLKLMLSDAKKMKILDYDKVMNSKATKKFSKRLDAMKFEKTYPIEELFKKVKKEKK